MYKTFFNNFKILFLYFILFFYTGCAARPIANVPKKIDIESFSNKLQSEKVVSVKEGINVIVEVRSHVQSSLMIVTYRGPFAWMDEQKGFIRFKRTFYTLLSSLFFQSGNLKKLCEIPERACNP